MSFIYTDNFDFDYYVFVTIGLIFEWLWLFFNL
jgi:hypothetical protein